ncbi:MAG: TRAP transporter large permease [Rubrobacteraceae bacterium]|uniref:TRAP transporter large permease n=1 Tax=Rubrobacter naiadicus TaxID=1392641 RepID=UPI00235E226B|nr:TRAP transporter large permease [Rubrobacter naiadicus]MCL6439426.1 TRAP transporter large permease [Rubrobacteraceae bacterium]
MSPETLATLILLGGFVLLLLLSVPVALCMAFTSIVAGYVLDISPTTIGQKMVDGLNSFPLIAIPFFILAGEIMAEGGISRRLIALSNLVVGWLRGGLAMVDVVASMFFGGISGSSVADASAIGSVMIPMMRKKGYDNDYATSVTMASAAQGVIIPPSQNMIIYSLAAGGVSIGALFAGGIIPGILLGLAVMVLSYVIAVRRGYPKEAPVPLREVPKIVWEGFLGLLTPVIILGGILSGVFTATESAAIATAYAFVVTFFVYREIPLRRMVPILQRTIRTVSIVFFLISAASAFGFLLTLLGIPSAMSHALLSISTNKYVVLFMVNVLLLFLGTFMDMAPLILIMTPILLPVVTQVGMSPVHFGVMLIFNLAIGLITPPVGSVLFVGTAIGKISMEKLSVSMLPFYVPLLVVLFLITFVPAFVMTIPRLMGL